MSTSTHPTVELELELTFLARSLPEQISTTTPARLMDAYVPEDQNVHPRLRLRRKGDRYELTKKLPVVDGDASQHHELTVALEAAEFDCLTTATARRVEKDRYRVTIDGHPAEVDVFRGALQGLVLIDFEFGDLEAMGAFTPPACCGPDVTQEDFIAGGLLAGKRYTDIEPELDRLGYVRLD